VVGQHPLPQAMGSAAVWQPEVAEATVHDALVEPGRQAMQSPPQAAAAADWVG